MSTNPAPTAAPGQAGSPFKSQEELEAFLRRVVAEEVSPAIDKALTPLTEKQRNQMREMLEEFEHDRAKGKGPVLPKGHMFARSARAMALAFVETGRKGDIDAALHTVKKFWGADDPVVKSLEQSAKLKATAAQASDPASLGNLLAPQWSMEFIELLRNKPVIRSIASVIPNPTGSLTLRRQTSAGTAYWVGEGQSITPSKPGVGLMSFIRKKLAALYVASNDLLRYSTGPMAIQADQLMLSDMLLVTALAEDLAFIRGDGNQHSPKGIRNLVVAAHVFAQTGTTLAAIDADFTKALRLQEEANVFVEPNSIHWLLVPRTFYGLWNVAAATDTGSRPYRDGLQQIDAQAPQGRILGQPVRKTNQIPKNLGGGSNESETYCVHGPSLWIADTLNVQVDIFPGGAYQDGGVVVSGISNDETPIRVLKETDFNMRYQEAASVITGVTLS
jgi:HK97 family phage major capsid protein